MESQRRNDMSETEDRIGNWLSNSRRVVIVGIGNPLRKDDFVGVEIVRNLQNRVSEAVYLIECETVPENFIEPIIRFNPSHVLLIDAALLNLEPGSPKLLSSKQLIKQHAVSTHALPLRIFCEYLARETDAKIALLIVQPKDTSFGEGLTKEVQNSADHMSRLLSRLLRA